MPQPELLRKTNFKLSNLNLRAPSNLWPTGYLPSKNSKLCQTHHACAKNKKPCMCVGIRLLWTSLMYHNDMCQKIGTRHSYSIAAGNKNCGRAMHINS